MSLHRFLASLWKRTVGRKPPATQRRQERRKEVQHHNDPVRALVDGVNRALDAHERHEEEHGNDNIKNRRIGWMAITIAIGAFVSSTLQFCEMQKTTRETRKAVSAAITQSKAALEANELMRDEQRAWIKAEFTAKKDVAYPLSIRVSNVGKRPAMQVFTRAAFHIVDSDKPAALDLSGPGTTSLEGMLFPSDGYPFDVPPRTPDAKARRLTDAEVRRLASGEAYAVVYGVIEYRDQFGEYWTRFCDWRAFKPDITVLAANCTKYNAEGKGKAPIK